VFHAFRHDVHFACPEVDGPVPEIDSQRTVQNDERLSSVSS
jgi:hypothetical protein